MSAPPSKPPSANSRLEVLSGAGGAKMIAMEFYGMDIDHLLRLLSYAAQVTIVKSDQVSGPITVIAPEPVPLDVAFQILDSVLQVRGFTMVKTPTGVYKVLPMAEGAQAGLPMQFGNQLQLMPPGDELITQVVPLTNLSANDVASQLQGILSQNANLIPTSTNSLIITDTAANIHRALALIENAEGELSGGLKVFRLQYYDASDMSDLVSSLVLSRGGGAGAVGPRPTFERRVVAGSTLQSRRVQPRPQPAGSQAGATMGPEFAYPDARTNSLIVLATPTHLTQIEDLVSQLDRPVSLRDSYFVYPVQNLTASELADSIAPLIGAEVTRTGTGETAGQASRAAATTTGRTARGQSGRQGQPYSRPFDTRGAGGVYGSSDPTPPSADAARGRPMPPLQLEPLSADSSPERSADALIIAQAPEAGAPVQLAPQPERPDGAEAPPAYVAGAGGAQSVIVADDNTNTLLISAPPEQIDLVEQMLEKLDVLPPQVHIRAIIAEVTLSRDTSLGFQWESLGRTWGAFRGNAFTGDIGANLGLKTPVRDAKGNVTSVPSGFFATLSGTEFDAVVNALTSDSTARILSAPSIFTSNNQRATIDISQQIPIPTGTFQTSTGVGAISTSIGYRSVGIVLDVTPRITQGDIVQMDISLSADEPGAEVVVADLSYPSINQRLAEATISVKNGYTVVLGGLMRETITHTASRVPLLGDLPLIGPLFSSTKASKSKSELLLFLTPFVVRNPAELADLTDREKSRLPEVPKSLQGPSSGTRARELVPPPPPSESQEPPIQTPRIEGPAAAPSGEKPAAAPAPEAQPQPPAAEAPQAQQPAPSSEQPVPPAEPQEAPAQ